MANDTPPWEREDTRFTPPWETELVGDRPGPILAEWHATPAEPTEDRPKYLGDLPEQPKDWRIERSPQTGQMEYVEGADKVRAVFADQPEAGQDGRVSARMLASARPDTASLGKQALAGGALQGATFDFADELAAAVEAPFSKQTYSQLRDENRAAFRDAEAGDPGGYVAGKLLGGAATVAMPGVGMAGAGKPLLSLGNVARGGLYGGAQAAGESEADLTKGEAGKFALDVAKGVGVGAGATTALGAAGAGVRKGANWLHAAPEVAARKADDALIDAATLGAPAGQRDALMGELGMDRPRVLEMIRSNPEIKKALEEGRKADAAILVRSMQTGAAAEDAAAMAAIDQSKRIDVAPIVSRLEARAQQLEASPSAENLAEAAAIRKRIEMVNERFAPEGPVEWDAGKDAKYLYHATKRDKLAGIQKEGLKPFGPLENSQDPWPGGGTEPRVFFGTEPGAAWKHGSASSGEGGAVLLRTPDAGTSQVAPKVARSMFETSTIPGERLELWTKDGWIPVKEWSGQALPKSPPLMRKAVAVPPIVKRLEAQRDALAVNPSAEAQAQVAKLQKRIDLVKEKWIPEPKPEAPKGNELLGKLVEGADVGDKQRAGSNAAEFLAVAEKSKLGTAYAKGPEVLLGKIDDTLESLNKKTAAIYDNAGKGATRATATAYRMEHKAPTSGAPLHDLTASEVYPRDVYETLRYYRTGEARFDDAAEEVVNRVRGKPDEVVQIYRAVPKGVDQINPGDWVTINKAYAQQHAKLPDGGQVRVISAKVPARDLRTNGDSLQEWGYSGEVSLGGGGKASGGGIFVANVTGKLREWADELRRAPGGTRIADADKIDNVHAAAGHTMGPPPMTSVIAKWAANTGKTTMTPKELRAFITGVQGKAFSGSYLDPTEAKAMQRELAGKLREVLDDHVTKYGSKTDLSKLGTLNRQISALITFRDAAEKRALASRFLPPAPPETRTGFAPVADAVSMANATEDPAVKALLVEELSKQIGAPVADPNRGKALPSAIREMAATTKDPDIKRDITGALYDQTGDEAARRMAALDDRAELLARLAAPLSYGAAREASPPTTLRSGVKKITEAAGQSSVRGVGGAGVAVSAFGAPHVGIPMIVGAILAKHRNAAADKVNKAAVAMEYALRRGAKNAVLGTIGKGYGLADEVTDDLVRALAPRAAASAVTDGRDEE